MLVQYTVLGRKDRGLLDASLYDGIVLCVLLHLCLVYVLESEERSTAGLRCSSSRSVTQMYRHLAMYV